MTEPPRTACTSAALPTTPRMSVSSSSAAGSASASGSGPEPASGSAGTGPSTRVSSDESGSGSPFAAVSVAPGIVLPGLPAGGSRVLEGLDSLSRIGVTPPPALGAEDQQSLKGLTAVRPFAELLPLAHGGSLVLKPCCSNTQDFMSRAAATHRIS